MENVLNLRGTVEFDEPITGGRRRVTVVVCTQDDVTAEEAQRAYEADQITVDDLFGLLPPHATVEVRESDQVAHYTGVTFCGGAVLTDLDGAVPVRVLFEDLTPATP